MKEKLKFFSKIRRVLTIVGIFCGLSLANAVSSANYIPPVPGKITIVASTLVPPGWDYTSADFERAKDCGFNTTFIEAGVNKMAQIVKEAANSGMHIILSNGVTSNGDPNSKDYQVRLDNLIKECSGYKSVAGYYFSDEPSWESLPALKKRYDFFQQILNKYNSRQFIFLNLVGVEKNKNYNPGMDYSTYVDHIAEMFRPPFLSFDVYPIVRFPRALRYTVKYEDYYRDFAALAAMREKYGIPFWSYCMTMEHSNTQGYYQPRPTEGYLRFEAFTALAYGAQGILYWTYTQRPSNDLETYLSAPIDLNGNKTKTWDRVRNVNMDIHAFNDVFFNAVPLKCVHTGKIAAKVKPAGYTSAEASKEKLPNVKITSQKDGVLISHLKNGEKRYIVMVNQSPFKSQKIKFYLERDFKYQEYTASNGNLKITDLPSGKQSRKLQAGDILVLEYSK